MALSPPPNASLESAPEISLVKADVVSVEETSEKKESAATVDNASLNVSTCDVCEGSTNNSPGKISPSNSNSNKPSILRKNISRLRRRKRPTESEGVAVAAVKNNAVAEITAEGVQSNESYPQAQRKEQLRDQAHEIDEEEAKLESMTSNNDEDDGDSSSSPPKISIILAHDNEVVVEQLLPYASAAARTPNNETKTPDKDLFYSPLKLLSPPQKRPSTTSASPQPKGIIKRHSSSRLSSSSLGSLGSPTTSRRVSFDETTIIKQERKRKSQLEGLRMAMPVILPYLIAILILILSSLVPPATPPPSTATDSAAVESKKIGGFMSKFVTVPVRPSTTGEVDTGTAKSNMEAASRVFSSISSSPIVGGKNETTTPSRGCVIRQNISEALWTPHSVYDRVVTISKFNQTDRYSGGR